MNKKTIQMTQSHNTFFYETVVRGMQLVVHAAQLASQMFKCISANACNCTNSKS